MKTETAEAGVELFTTCPPSSSVDGAEYLERVGQVARWSERAGCRGMLVYADNSLVDPWLIAQAVVQETRRLCPLVAVQPAYMHPYSVAKLVSSLGSLYGRRIYLNMVAGGFQNDLIALNDTTPHDQRYERLVEYTTIITRLLAGPSAVTYAGTFYRIQKLRLTPPLPPELFPGIFVSGSSEAGRSAAASIGATAIVYPTAPGEMAPALGADGEHGIRVGIITRDDEDRAWQIAHRRFPPDRKGQITHQLAMKVSDSVWHRQLSELADPAEPERTPYWLVPFRNYRTFCPYMVGSYERVADELARYFALGYRTVILDVPPDEEELRHTAQALRLASERVAR
jgi:alkanesulfonate monooxygenase